MGALGDDGASRRMSQESDLSPRYRLAIAFTCDEFINSPLVVDWYR
jgi:hypothetical protein